MELDLWVVIFNSHPFARSSEPLHHICDSNAEAFTLVEIHDRITADGPKFGNSRKTSGKALLQLVLRPSIKPEDRTKGGFVTTGKINS